MTYEYEKDTRQAYRDPQKARVYKLFYTRRLTWGRFTSWRIRLAVQSALRRCGLAPQARILDIPCGTGIMGEIFRHLPNPVVAADISLEMMALAEGEYDFPHFLGFVQSDITQTPFRPGDFSCIITLGLMHRLPAKIRANVLAKVVSLKPRYIIISYSIDSPWQRFKQQMIKRLKPAHIPAPAPAPYQDIVREIQASGLKILNVHYAVPLASATAVLVLEQQPGVEAAR